MNVFLGDVGGLEHNSAFFRVVAFMTRLAIRERENPARDGILPSSRKIFLPFHLEEVARRFARKVSG